MGRSRSPYHSFLATLFLFISLQHSEPAHSLTERTKLIRHRKPMGSCNLFQGTWALDNSYPLYNSSNCPYIKAQFDCQKNGRPDSLYLKYSWKPNACDLPRFNGEDFLGRMRGKKVMFVGDSLGLNQWESLLCLLHAAMPQAKTSFVRGEVLSSLTFEDYNLSMMYFRSPYLVDLVSENRGVVLKLDSIQTGHAWKGMDMLIFNTWHWWVHTGKDQPWSYIEDGNVYYKDMDRLVAFQKGLTTWSKWVESNVDLAKTKVFFQGISPVHYQGKEWNENGSNCLGQTQPLNGSAYPAGPPPAYGVMKGVLGSMTIPVYLLDVTTLSQLRKDGHSSKYGGSSGVDCSHWCLAGVPDTWNQLLYAAILP